MTRRELHTLAERLYAAFRRYRLKPGWAAREAIRRHAAGEPYHVIAAAIGVTPGTARYYILAWLSGAYEGPGHAVAIRRSRKRLQAGLAKRGESGAYWNIHRRYSPERWERELRRVANGRQTFAETAKKLAVTPCAVYQQAKREIAGLGLSAALSP